MRLLQKIAATFRALRLQGMAFSLVLALLTVATSAEAVDVKAKNYWKLPPERFAVYGLEEPPAKAFPLVFHISLGSRGLYQLMFPYSPDVGVDPKLIASLSGETIEVPLYVGMLLVHKDYSRSFIPAGDKDRPAQAAVAAAYAKSLKKEEPFKGWKGLGQYLGESHYDGSFVVLAKPGSAPDRLFVPHFAVNATATFSKSAVKECFERVSADRIEELVNPQEGMRVLRFVEVYYEGWWALP